MSHPLLLQSAIQHSKGDWPEEMDGRTDFEAQAARLQNAGGDGVQSGCCLVRARQDVSRFKASNCDGGNRWASAAALDCALPSEQMTATALGGKSVRASTALVQYLQPAARRKPRGWRYSDRRHGRQIPSDSALLAGRIYFRVDTVRWLTGFAGRSARPVSLSERFCLSDSRVDDSEVEAHHKQLLRWISARHLLPEPIVRH